MTFRTALSNLLILACAAANGAVPQVRAGGEHLVGTSLRNPAGVAVFRGIPFAAPPIGDLRWRAPQPAIPRPGQQDATRFAPACPQGEHLIDWYAGVARAFGHDGENVARPNGVSEDCLYLNVWTPTLDNRSGLPVIVWFHGGSNKSGWSYEPNYDGAALAARGIVVVTTTYRLGPLGFFAHPAQAASGTSSANFGYQDSVASLEWVQDNIGAFGGDPNNVTVMGESSGAGNLANIIGAEATQGLYRRAIAQSPAGNLERLPTYAEAAADGIRISAELGIDDDDDAMARLRTVDSMALIDAAYRALPGHYYDVILDETSVTQPMLTALQSPERRAVDFLIGTNAHEWYMYLDPDTSKADVDAWIAEHAPTNTAAVKAVVATADGPRRALDRLTTAQQMLCPARKAAAQMATLGGQTWMYYFTRQRSGRHGAALGAYHGAEIPYVFDTHDDWLPTNATDRALTDTMMDYWAQFARTGDPNIAGRAPWPRYRPERPQVMVLGDEVGAAAPIDAALCLWIEPG